MRFSQVTQKTSPTADRTRVGPTVPTATRKNTPRGGILAGMSTTSCILRVAILLAFLAVALGAAGASYIVYKYYTIASSLPDVTELREHASQFETTRILDRNGNLLYEILDPNAGRRTYVPLEKISPYVLATTLATEDKEFYSHPGFNIFAMLRALFQNVEEGETVSGASTITQQVARMLLMNPEERSQVSFRRKAREIILAAEITRRYTKDEILELYLNEINYGNLSYGIEAAAESYFNTTADKLTFAQASFLAGLPQAPAVYDIFANREATLNRHKQVLTLTYQMSQEDGCIAVSNNRDPVCISAEEATVAAGEMDIYEFVPTSFPMLYPHWVNYVRTQLETLYDPQTIYRLGFTVYTTLDPYLQSEAERLVKQQIDLLQDQHVTNGALVAIRPATGEILTMVGSADFYNTEISGQVNMATSQTRQPGSSIKPLTYVAAFEKGWTPSTLIWDVSSEFPPSGDPNDTREPYKPVNYDGRYHGPVTVRTALANSYNMPAVKTLNFVGIYDNPETEEEEGLIAFARRLGITSLTRNDYGLSLTLGGGELSLLELSGAYSVFANGGRKVSPVSILRITDYQGKTVYEYAPPAGDQVIREEHAYLISSILSDTRARVPAFGNNPIINLPFTVAAKTGTSNDFRDNWTLGYTPDLVVGVWVGNADYTPMLNTTGLTGAAPIWAEFMQTGIQIVTGGNPTGFARPAGIIEKSICSLSGTEPSDRCPDQRIEVFAFDQPPLTKEYDLWQQIDVDTWTGLKSSSNCQGSVEEKLTLFITDKWAIRWVMQNEVGENWALDHGFSRPIIITPTRACTASDSQPVIQITSFSEGQTLTTSPHELSGVIDATTNFDYYSISYESSAEPGKWVTLVDHNHSPVKSNGKIFSWDLSMIPSGQIILKIYLHSTSGGYTEKKYRLNVSLPTLMPTTTATSTATPTFVPPTITPTNTNIPADTPTPTITPVPTETPTPTETPIPAETSTLEEPTTTP
jgi:penicillin-binding protein 1C